ncbi:MAG: shikimate dehydrogenase [Thaumarchaeota archaeon]|nr:shikimate dehydrogenase [Nitrososphaerota archaeon]
MKKYQKRRVAEKDRQKINRILLLGYGISKSISPSIHKKAFTELGIAAEYALMDVGDSELEAKLSEIKNSADIIGFNVTIPYKERVLFFMSDLDNQARVVGAVNTVKFDQNRRMIGYNTDVDGIIASLSRLGLVGREKGRKAVVLGAGGAARACIYATLTNGFDRIIILNRTEGRASVLVSEFKAKFPGISLEFSKLSSADLDESIAENCDLLINTIPTAGDFPVKTKFETASNTMKFFDLSYRGPTPLLKAASYRGLDAIDGLLMLVEQAARSFEIWTGISAPRKTMMQEARSQVSQVSRKSNRRLGTSDVFRQSQ